MLQGGCPWRTAAMLDKFRHGRTIINIAGPRARRTGATSEPNTALHQERKRQDAES